MVILVHGTTRSRAERIVVVGPDPHFREPDPRTKLPAGPETEGFSTYLKSGPFILLPPDDYAESKALQFPDEGGPVILEIVVPDDLVALAADDTYFPLYQGLVQFDLGHGLKELREAWPRLIKRIVPVKDL
jgi:hypothetical protein